ncbi:hypothetical protein EV195_10845 [Tenacibaculum skagerrakense]|uniref:Uncharacterized protein n=1 Tax=Tenacibaculum skagerrakense TaxID=186571 RepID=A0A4V2SLI2_9FLAO|nr:hypothetical protein [Tenacibaculum skagerrakense]TCP23576.1 hypothetical protein EV195_10845 [Tenacibaculum skagerrakense]
MESLITITLIGFIVVFIYDVVGSLLSRFLGFEYVWWAFGSFVIYGTFGVYIHNNIGFTAALTATFLLGAFDATAGIVVADKLKAIIREEDKEVVKISFSLIFQMGMIALAMGLIAILLF